MLTSYRYPVECKNGFCSVYSGIHYGYKKYQNLYRDFVTQHFNLEKKH